MMTSMRMRLVSSVSFVALLFKRCRLLCEALVATSCCFTFETSTMQKPRFFEAFQTKTSQRTPKIINNKRRKAWYLQQFRKKKRNPKKRQRTMESKNPKHRLVDENHAKLRVFNVQAFDQKPPQNKRHTPRGGRRTCYLVAVVVLVLVLVLVVCCLLLVLVIVVVGVVRGYGSCYCSVYCPSCCCCCCC